jgi:protein PhnA
MSENNICPKCQSDLTYEDGNKMVCTQCFHEWTPQEEKVEANETADKVLDSNGNELKDGDSVTVIKDLPVKGALRPIKAGTKVKNIRILANSENGHNIACKIEGFGTMNLKSEFLKRS